YIAFTIQRYLSVSDIIRLTAVSSKWRQIWLPYLYQRPLIFFNEHSNFHQKRLIKSQTAIKSCSKWLISHGPYLNFVKHHQYNISITNHLIENCTSIVKLSIPFDYILTKVNIKHKEK